MNGLVLNEGGYVTYPCKVLKAIEPYVRSLIWRISGVEFAGEYPYPFNADVDTVIDGNALFEIIGKHSGTQWVWGLLSGFPKDLTEDKIRQSPVVDISVEQPYLQDGLHHIQDKAVLEIVAFDSSETYVLFDDEKLQDILVSAFPQAENLKKRL